MEKFLKAFSDKFGEVSRYEDTYKVLDYFLDYFLNDYCDTDNQKDLTPVLRIFPKEVGIDTFVQLREIVLECWSKNPYRDLLGQFYTFSCADKRLGQFFTPPEIADLQAQLVIGNNPQFGQTVFDPTCGSGGLLLSAAKVFPYFLFFGCDVSAICCKMTLVNYLISGMIGEVCHMNPLTNQFFQVYFTGVRKAEKGQYHMYFVQSSDSRHSVIHGKSAASEAA